MYDLVVGWAGLGSLLQEEPPDDQELLIQVYAVSSSAIGHIEAMGISAVLCDLVDIEILGIQVVREVFASSSVEILIGDCSDAVPSSAPYNPKFW
jgi:hypothetical protein